MIYPEKTVIEWINIIAFDPSRRDEVPSEILVQICDMAWLYSELGK